MLHIIVYKSDEKRDLFYPKFTMACVFILNKVRRHLMENFVIYYECEI